MSSWFVVVFNKQIFIFRERCKPLHGKISTGKKADNIGINMNANNIKLVHHICMYAFKNFSRELQHKNAKPNKNYYFKLAAYHKCPIRVITKLPNSEQSYKGKVKTHNYINRQNQSTTGKLKTVMILTCYRHV